MNSKAEVILTALESFIGLARAFNEGTITEAEWRDGLRALAGQTFQPGDTVRGHVLHLDIKTGVSSRGPWRLVIATLSPGVTVRTFDTTWGDKLVEAAETGAEVSVRLDVGRRGWEAAEVALVEEE